MKPYRVYVWPKGYASEEGRVPYLIKEAEDEACARRQVQKLLTGAAKIDSVVPVIPIANTPPLSDAYCRSMSARDNS